MAIRWLLVFLLSTGASLWATPCADGPLSGYLGVGFTCTVSGVDFDLWSYAPGATGVLATSVWVMPSVAGPVFEFAPIVLGSAWAQPPGGFTSGSIGFRGTGAIVGTRLYLGGGGPPRETPGGVTLVTGICLNSTLPGCGGGTTQPSISSFNFFPGPPPVILSESFYPLAASVDILTTFTITGGDGGAGLSTFESGFYAPVPEPSTFALAVSGLAVVVAAAARRRRTK